MQPKKGSLQSLMQKIPGVTPGYLARAVRKAMGRNGKSTSGVSKTEGLRWACSHVNAVKKVVEENGWQVET